jgi:hypothetical protein
MASALWSGMNNATKIVDIAARNVNLGSMSSSAKLCLDDANALLALGDEAYAAKRALESLSYSVGFFHPDFATAKAMAAE